MAGIILGNGTPASSEASINTDGALLTRLSTDPAKGGSVSMFSECHNGDAGSAALRLSPESTTDYRLRVETENICADHSFNYTAQATSLGIYNNTTMTITWAGGFLNTNGSGITTLSTGCRYQTYQAFTTYGEAPLYLSVVASLTNTPTTNTTIDLGLGFAAAANPYAPTDGIYFRVTSAGVEGIVCNNTTEVSTGTLDFTWENNKTYRWIIVVSTKTVQFWIDDVLYGSVDRPSAVGNMTMSTSLPVFFRQAISASAASQVIGLKVARYTVSLGSLGNGRPWRLAMAAQGGMAYQGQEGGTMGTTANYANSANPTAAVPTNTTAALGTGLGGQFWETDTVAVTTDCIICSYQVPAAGINTSGKQLIVYGVKVSSFVQAALTGGGYVAQWSVAFGHSTLSLATAEGPTAKAPRRVALGVQAVASGATANTVLTDVYMKFDCPIVVNPGEFIALVKKKVGTAPSAGTIAHVITFDAVLE